MKYFAIAALLAATSATRITQLNANRHATDYINEDGSEISTSLMPEYVQLNAEMRSNENDVDDTVAGAKEKWANMQAQMD